jgi:hypothetical protein
MGKKSDEGAGTMMRGRKREKKVKGRTSIDRSVNLRGNGRVQLGQIDLVRLVASVAHYFGDIRRYLNSNIGDGVDGGVRRISWG